VCADALPKRTSAKVVPLGVVDVQDLAAAVPERYRARIVFAAGMGLRQAECFGLTMDRVDFLRRAVRVDRQVVAVRGGNQPWERRTLTRTCGQTVTTRPGWPSTTS
jgi:hypothetical protein